MNFSDRGFLCKGTLLVIIIGIAIRLSVGYLMTYNYDVYHWALTISNFEAGNGLYGTAGYYYTPVWGYILGFFSQFFEFFGVSEFGYRFEELLFTEDLDCFSPHTAFVTSMGFNFAITIMMTIFDLITAYLIYWVVREVYRDENKAKICFSVWFLFSFVIIVSAIGGMFDSISALFLLLMVCLLLKDQELLAGVIFTMAVLLKLFPCFVIFLLIAYIIVKHREDWKPRVLKAMLGSLAMFIVLMLPQFMDGTVSDSFSFLTARAASDASMMETVVKFGSIAMYLLVIAAEILLAVLFIRRRHDDLNRALILYTFVGMTIVFLTGGAPQYVIPLVPLLIIVAFCCNERFRVPMLVLMVCSSVYMLSPFVMDFTPLVMYTDMFPLESWMGLYDAFDFQFMGVNGFNIWMLFGAALQGISIILVFVTIILEYRSSLQRLLSKEQKSA
jgi:hypothetical protein